MASIGPVMRTSLALLIILVAGVPLWAYAQNKPMAEREKIEALIKHIESLKDAVFIRNGREYDAKAAGSFLRAKWRVNDAEVKSAKDFIAKVASVSSTTGKPYLIRFKDGREVKCGDYLLAELMKLEQTPRALRGVLAGAYQSARTAASSMPPRRERCRLRDAGQGCAGALASHCRSASSPVPRHAQLMVWWRDGTI